MPPMTLELNIDYEKLAEEMIKRILPSLSETLKAKELPEWLSTKQASEFLGINPTTLRERVYQGWYKEDLHFRKKNGKLYEWSRSALSKE